MKKRRPSPRELQRRKQQSQRASGSTIHDDGRGNLIVLHPVNRWKAFKVGQRT